MRVIVDTCIWSEAFRKPASSKFKDIIVELQELIKESRIVIIGAIRQELLSGIKSEKDYNRLKETLQEFEDYVITTEDYEYAADLFNRCRKKGLQGSNTDFLICSVALKNNLSIFTTDNDFEQFSKHINIHLHKIRSHDR